MKGSAVPALVALFAITIVMGGFSFGVVTNKAKGLFDQVGQEKNSVWVEDNLQPVVMNMCESSGTQSVQPSGNLTSTFPGIKSISFYDADNTRQNGYQPAETIHLKGITLNYEGVTHNRIFEASESPNCYLIHFNGTEPDGSKISWGNKIDLESDSLNFRVFETGSDGNITVQVRQD